MTIIEAAEHFCVSKEAIHNRVRRGSLEVVVVDGIKYVKVDDKTKPAPKTKSNPRRGSLSSDDRYYKLLEEQNLKLQEKVEKLEGETRTLRDQKEQMLIDERIKMERIYKEKDEQLKNILSTISSQFMLNAPIDEPKEDHLDAEITEVQEIEKPKKKKKGELISLKNYLKEYKFSKEKSKKIKKRFKKHSKKDERVIILDGKFYMDTIKYEYKDLLK